MRINFKRLLIAFGKCFYPSYPQDCRHSRSRERTFTGVHGSSVIRVTNSGLAVRITSALGRPRTAMASLNEVHHSPPCLEVGGNQ